MTEHIPPVLRPLRDAIAACRAGGDILDLIKTVFETKEALFKSGSIDVDVLTDPKTLALLNESCRTIEGDPKFQEFVDQLRAAKVEKKA